MATGPCGRWLSHNTRVGACWCWRIPAASRSIAFREPMELGQFLRLAIRLSCGSERGYTERGLIHKDIKPAMFW